MEKLQAKGEIPEEELKALELDMTGKVRGLSHPASVDTYNLLDHACVVARHSLRGYASPTGGVRQSFERS